MPDPGLMSFAESLVSFSSVVFFIFVGASILILWQVAILVGTLIANRWRKETRQESAPPGMA